MNNNIVKFTSSELDGYGFDIAADRVVRFNKHPDGTYLNTRATYYINKHQYTHFDLRKTALSENIPKEKHKTTNRKKLFVVLAILIIVFALSECSVEFNSNVTTLNDTEEKV